MFKLAPRNAKMNQSAEEKIKNAALRVFIQKGSANCTSREIAREAGMNVALVNYYFRSKSKLFAIIFESVMQDFLKSMVQVFSADLPIREKIRILIEREFEFLGQHPDIPNFVLNELARNPEAIEGFIPVLNMVNESGVFDEAKKLQERGEMRQMDIVQITILIMSNCQYPFMAQPLMKVIHGVSNETYKEHLNAHKTHAVNMVLGYLFPNDKQ
ncbi:MAG: TetR/AcrR family transcriptional regulator [Flavobacteriales bacterium]